MSHPTDCAICVNIDPALNNTENARNLNTSEASIRRHKTHLVTADTDSIFGVPTSIITSRGKTLRLPDGSYEKITYSPAKAALLEVLKYDDIERALDNYTFTPPNVHMGGYEHTAFNLCLADFQTGKSDANGGTPELIERVMHSLWARQWRYGSLERNDQWR